MHAETRPQPLARLLVLVSLGFGITVLANTMEPAVLGHRILELVPERANTAMGLTTFAGLVVATVTQPVVGYLSDRTRGRSGRRLPYLAGGTLLVLCALGLLVIAPSLALVCASFLLLQMGSNTIQGPWQALIPDLVPESQRNSSAALALQEAIIAVLEGAAPDEAAEAVLVRFE